MRTLSIAALALLTGCATSSFNEIAPDGTQTAVNYTVFAPPFATAVADQGLDYQGEGWHLVFGQNAQVDGGNPTELLNAFFGGLTAFQASRPPEPVRQPVLTPEFIAAIREALQE